MVVTYYLILLCVICSNSIHIDIPSIPDLIRSNGYPAETHTVTTHDDYIISMYRIPHGKNKDDTGKKPVVYLQHGLLASSDAWVLIGPNSGLAYLLADHGYDVWMGNSRGNTFSLGHKKLKTSSKKYWDFTMHEMGIYDLPANIDFILKETGEEELYYVGHSQGCATFFILNSVIPKYNNKIKAFFGLAPAVYLGNMATPAAVIVADVYKQDKLKIMQKWIGPFDLMPHSNISSYISGELCKDGSSTQEICALSYLATAGFAPEQLNKTFMPTLMKYFPAGTSSKQALLFIQEKISGSFSRFDYGEPENKRKYKSSKVPTYNISAVTVPVHLYHGGKDLCVVPKDVIKLAQEVTNLRERNEISEISFAHNDFVYGLDVKKYVYDHILNTLDEYSGKNIMPYNNISLT